MSLTFCGNLFLSLAPIIVSFYYNILILTYLHVNITYFIMENTVCSYKHQQMNFKRFGNK